MITVFGRADSSNVQAVMWGAAEMDLTPDRLDYGHRFGGTDSPEFRAMSPHGLVPVLKDADTVVWESCAILRYLAAQYADEAFWPSEPRARAGVDMWAEWAKISFAIPFTVPIFWARVRTSAADRDEAELVRAIARFSSQLDILDAQLDGKAFVTGERLTLADIIVGHLLYRYYDIDIPRADHPNVAAYYQRLTERPAYRDHVMISYEALRDPNA